MSLQPNESDSYLSRHTATNPSTETFRSRFNLVSIHPQVYICHFCNWSVLVTGVDTFQTANVFISSLFKRFEAKKKYEKEIGRLTPSDWSKSHTKTQETGLVRFSVRFVQSRWSLIDLCLQLRGSRPVLCCPVDPPTTRYG